MRILRNFLGNVKEAPGSFVQGMCWALLMAAIWCVAGQIGEKVCTFSEDIHTIAEEIRDSDIEF